MPNLTELFCLVDDFCKVFEQQQDAKLIATGEKQRRRKTSLSLSELMVTILPHLTSVRHCTAVALSLT